jgi:hypothetical protein
MCRYMFVLCVLSISGSTGSADEAEDKAVDFVKKLGGKVERDEKAKGMPVNKINLQGTKVTDLSNVLPDNPKSP